jgi:hypothetical protein
MVEASEMQLRFVYSLLKPAVRAADRMGLPIRTLLELVRLSYYEHLSRSGLTKTEIAERFGQTPRHMRSLANRLESDFFRAEREGGLVREVEAVIGAAPISRAALSKRLPSWSPHELDEAVSTLLREERIEETPAGELQMARAFVLLSSDEFHHRIDSLNHLLGGVYNAVVNRLLLDDRRRALMKTISFSALEDELVEFVRRLEGLLRQELSDLDEKATFAGQGDQRYTLSITLSPAEPPSPPEKSK